MPAAIKKALAFLGLELILAAARFIARMSRSASRLVKVEYPVVMGLSP